MLAAKNWFLWHSQPISPLDKWNFHLFPSMLVAHCPTLMWTKQIFHPSLTSIQLMGVWIFQQSLTLELNNCNWLTLTTLGKGFLIFHHFQTSQWALIFIFPKFSDWKVAAGWHGFFEATNLNSSPFLFSTNPGLQISHLNAWLGPLLHRTQSQWHTHSTASIRPSHPHNTKKNMADQWGRNSQHASPRSQKSQTSRWCGKLLPQRSQVETTISWEIYMKLTKHFFRWVLSIHVVNSGISFSIAHTCRTPCSATHYMTSRGIPIAVSLGVCLSCWGSWKTPRPSLKHGSWCRGCCQSSDEHSKQDGMVVYSMGPVIKD